MMTETKESLRVIKTANYCGPDRGGEGAWLEALSAEVRTNWSNNLQASSVSASGVGKCDCAWERTFIEGKAAASEAKGLRKDMGGSFSAGVNVAGALWRDLGRDMDNSQGVF